jgi:hypothetical protein
VYLLWVLIASHVRRQQEPTALPPPPIQLGTRRRGPMGLIPTFLYEELRSEDGLVLVQIFRDIHNPDLIIRTTVATRRCRGQVWGPPTKVEKVD